MRSLLSPGVSVCPSFRLSVTLVHCIQAAEDIVKLFVRPSSPIILVFDSQRRYQIPSAGAQNTRGGKNLRYSMEIAVYLGNGTR